MFHRIPPQFLSLLTITLYKLCLKRLLHDWNNHKLECAQLPEIFKQIIMEYGYLAMFVLLAVGIIGLPVPVGVLMTFIGYLALSNWFSLGMALIVCFTGTMAGMIISYLLGKKLGKPFLFRYGKWVKLSPSRLERAEKWFLRYGLWTVFLGYYVPGVRHFTCYLAGVSGIKFGRYFICASLGALLWCATFLLLGYFLGDSLAGVLKHF
jgi:membrane protein DedA with SNARE-associated domain